LSKHATAYPAHKKSWYEKHFQVFDRRFMISISVLLEKNGFLGMDGMDWIDQAQDRDQWMALVNTVMNPRVP
jgi:hypothetical protein